MKKLSIFFGLIALVFAVAGCLKDKGFEDQQYGIQIASDKAVSFPQTSQSPVVVGITGQPAPVVVDGPLLAIEDPSAPAANVTVKLAYDQDLVVAQGLVPLPAGTFSLNTLDAVIPAGSKTLGDLKLTVTNSDVLNPNLKYGVGFKIVSVDQGYKIAGNQSAMIIGFAIKNKYDGVYNLKGRHNRVPYTFPYDTEIQLVTTGPSTVIFYWVENDLGIDSYGHPIGVGANNSLGWYGAVISPVIEFNPATNLVTKVFNNPPNPTAITLFTGAGSRISKFDSATKAITVDWNYNNNPLRAFFDDLTYIKPRP